MYDSIIIGAGMSGLAAGIRLAMFQERVLIVERHSKTGGLNSYYKRHGREYDVGLHAVTNYRPKGSRQGPLVRLLRQLRLGWDDLGLAPQAGSSIVFPTARLDFGNDFDLLRSEVRRLFPRQTDGLERLVAHLSAYEELGQPATQASARQVAGGFLDDPLLVEMLLCPLLFYGGAQEEDMDFGQFSVLFRSIYLEGLGRPRGGVRPILAALAERFKAAGGELRLRAGVRRIVVQDGRATAVELSDGAELSARRIFSSAGWRDDAALRPAGLGSKSGRPARWPSSSRSPRSTGRRRTSASTARRSSSPPASGSPIISRPIWPTSARGWSARRTISSIRKRKRAKGEAAEQDCVSKLSPLPLGEGSGVRARAVRTSGAAVTGQLPRPHPGPLPKGEGTRCSSR